jgi:hypothetical protein
MTSTATPISAAAEQENENNDNQDQFHGTSPVMAMALCAACHVFNGVFKLLFPIKPTAQRADEQVRPATMPR